MAINATHKNIYFFGFKLSKNVDSNSIHLQIHESLLALNERLLLKSPTCWGLTAARFIKVLLQIYAVCYRIIFHNSWLTYSYYIKITFCFINEVFKFFNILRKRASGKMKEAHCTFLVQMIIFAWNA